MQLEKKTIISIIAPCYNVESYIDRCMESLVNQTIGLDKLQLIFVNDGSSDGTLEKLSVWEKNFPNNILVITYDDNRRQGAARNLGLQYADGKYIGFVDSDDWVEIDMYEELYRKMVSGDYDMVVCASQRDDGSGLTVNKNKDRNDSVYTFDVIDGISEMINVPIDWKKGYGSCFTGLYKKSIIFDHNIFFPEGLTYEDNYWKELYNLYVQKLYVIDDVYYHYFINDNSTILKRNSMHHLDKMTIEVMIIEEFKQRGLFARFYYYLLYMFVTRFYLNMLYTVYMRFDQIVVDINELGGFVYKYFPDVEDVLDINRFEKYEIYLLQILFSKKTYSLIEQEKIKAEYLLLCYKQMEEASRQYE